MREMNNTVPTVARGTYSSVAPSCYFLLLAVLLHITMDMCTFWSTPKCHHCITMDYLINEYKAKVHAAEAYEMDFGYDGNRPLLPFVPRPPITVQCDHCLYLQEQYFAIFDLYMWFTERKRTRERNETERLVSLEQQRMRNEQYALYHLPASSSSSSSDLTNPNHPSPTNQQSISIHPTISAAGGSTSTASSRFSDPRPISSASSACSSQQVSSPDQTAITNMPVSPMRSHQHPSSISSSSTSAMSDSTSSASSACSSQQVSSPDQTAITDMPLRSHQYRYPSSTSSHSSAATSGGNLEWDLQISSSSTSAMSDSTISIPDMSQVWPTVESDPARYYEYLNRAFVKYPNSVEDSSQSSSSDPDAGRQYPS